MPKVKKKIIQDESGVSEIEEAKPKKIVGNSVKVVLPDGSFRIYSADKDGSVWLDLAKNYAEANQGEIVAI